MPVVVFNSHILSQNSNYITEQFKQTPVSLKMVANLMCSSFQVLFSDFHLFFSLRHRAHMNITILTLKMKICLQNENINLSLLAGCRVWGKYFKMPSSFCFFSHLIYFPSLFQVSGFEIVLTLLYSAEVLIENGTIYLENACLKLQMKNLLKFSGQPFCSKKFHPPFLFSLLNQPFH